MGDVLDQKTWKHHQGRVLDTVGVFDVIECVPCSFKHVVPIPTAEELEQVYTHNFYLRDKPLYLERHREDLDWWNLVYSERYDTLEEQLDPKGGRRILDVGSGPGFFLLHGQQRGWATLGIEPSAQAAAHARGLGLEIMEAFLNESTARELGAFDAVHLSEVLEHVPDPKKLLTLIHGMLKPRGLVCIAVPNDYSPFQEALRKVCQFKPWWVAPPHHLNYFDFDSLSTLLKGTDFEVVAKEATFPIDMFLLMGDNYVGNDSLGRACHGKRKLFERNLEAAGLGKLRRELYRRLAEVGIGREVVITARRA